MQASVTALDVQARRAERTEQLKEIDPSHLVYLGECGVNTDMTRIYGRSIGKTRVVDHAPLNTPKTTTVLSSIRTDGSHVTETYLGGTNGERFTAYLRESADFLPDAVSKALDLVSVPDCLHWFDSCFSV